ncbi:MAG: hypothetical protein LBH25_12235 [Fibromonadaceae bacterium]|jgi:hypothetical protein|nr:hypothetical protein [Fibromonadaceae bacterium]
MNNHITLAAALALAITFTLSCSGGDNGSSTEYSSSSAPRQATPAAQTETRLQTQEALPRPNKTSHLQYPLVVRLNRKVIVDIRHLMMVIIGVMHAFLNLKAHAQTLMVF